MRFKVWFETNVDAWKSEIGDASSGRNFAFAEWFPPEGVVYLPFQSAIGVGDVDEDIASHFKDSEYEIQDYQKGLVKDKHGRPVRIGKVLVRDEVEAIKKIEMAYKQGQISDLKYKEDLLGMRKYYRELKTTFESSPLRSGVNAQSPYMIAISSKPDDHCRYVHE